MTDPTTSPATPDGTPTSEAEAAALFSAAHLELAALQAEAARSLAARVASALLSVVGPTALKAGVAEALSLLPAADLAAKGGIAAGGVALGAVLTPYLGPGGAIVGGGAASLAGTLEGKLVAALKSLLDAQAAKNP